MSLELKRNAEITQMYGLCRWYFQRQTIYFPQGDIKTSFEVAHYTDLLCEDQMHSVLRVQAFRSFPSIIGNRFACRFLLKQVF